MIRIMVSIGIDLGTTYSCVAAMQRGKVEIIANDEGSRVTPSCVAFTDEQRLIGEAAKGQMSRNTANTLFDIKRLIGRSFNDPSLQTNMRHWGFKVIECEQKPKVQVKYQGDTKLFDPEEISAMILSRMKEVAENFSGKPVHSAVITVPAYFNNSQRRATRDAAEIAQLHVLGILNEPTAAAIAYGLQRGTENEKKVLIFDLGGGTFDVTILKIMDEAFKVISTAGSSNLGGQDFNSRLYSHFASEFARMYDEDLTKNEKAKYRLRTESEKTKIMLSAVERVDVQIDALFGGLDFDTTITRAKFEQLNEDLFQSTLETIGKALEDARLDKDEIDNVVLVGGSTRIPIIQKMLGDYFGKDKICKTINPDEAVAFGAAAHAAFLSGDPSADIKFDLQDVTPLSLGIGSKGDVMTFVIRRNTPIPIKRWHNFTTVRDNQTVVNFPVYEGERANVKLNKLLGSFSLRGIVPEPKGEPEIKVCFAIDKDGVLNVLAEELESGKQNTILISNDRRGLAKENITRMIQEAERFKEEDKRWKERMNALYELESSSRRSVEQAEANPRMLAKKENIARLQPPRWTDDDDEKEPSSEYLFGRAVLLGSMLGSLLPEDDD